MDFKNINSWIFFVCTMLILIINNFIKSKSVLIPIYVLAILGIVYSIYTSKIRKKIKLILIGLYLFGLILYIFIMT
ncbi:Uncharacterised protein [[Clostridium] sordellii]|uniref:hypothetical protein n=1 Tax=Paraclostridium sordellii TaxID=1505 RepID=UPI0005E84DE1|nr:hypothetical protein [Paeniclostridium sordellii]MDU4415439.1 hypothetical protein [Paeniclostridium sordellii]CEN22914.1 Uncharacterised protein [[Clostridium] sordellii] [Paeniclostridium sordellii]CEP42396.1 Uncharacterised protein [[Clostridium] sordellii] [Paeniclostridium sordellii]CEP43521.1 Uncharacterised protein [[Clostridium] sordellii] [Paeniclostridium sordellii]